ncbi:hypothetical protein LWI29_013789 [Acer saccharum]|uniref:Uncharacterized protein n=1 Tax=Acer saccharum TaxID=4024 RepID=A0AA39TFD9_ACESA|nr:hypothetical protein LWI29_013789 [Acer saccharum]
MLNRKRRRRRRRNSEEKEGGGGGGGEEDDIPWSRKPVWVYYEGVHPPLSTLHSSFWDLAGNNSLWLSAKTLNFISVIEGDCNLESHFFVAVL